MRRSKAGAGVGQIGHDVNAPLPDHLVEKMMSDPMAMYLHSLRTFARLPDRLHEAMLLFSFDPSYSSYVKMYMEWVCACEEREKVRLSRERMEALQERTLVFLMLTCAVLFVFALSSTVKT